MPIEGVDLSFARPGGAALSAAGKRFVVRYLTGKPGKPLTASEVADYHAQGLAICLVFETTAGRARGGKDAGTADGQAAKAAAAKRGVPDDVPIYFAVDFDAQAADQPKIDAYLNAAGAVIGPERVGVYAGIRVINRCRANKSARWFWQTYAWSKGKIAPFIHLYQYRNHQTINKGLVDLDRAYRPNYGQWPQPVAVATGQRYVVTIKGGPVRLYTTVNGAVIGAVTLATYTCQRSKVDGLWWYTIVVGPRVGQALKPNRFVKARFA